MLGVFACTRGGLRDIKCKFCENLRLRTPALGLRFLKRSHPFFPRTPEASLPPRDSATWFGCWARGDVEWADGLAFSLPLSPEHVAREFSGWIAHDYLYPSLEARDTLLWARWCIANSSLWLWGFGPVLVSWSPPLPPAGRRRGLLRPTLSSWTCFPAPLKLSLDWPDEPRESRRQNWWAVLSGPNSSLKEESTIFQWSAPRDLQILETAFSSCLTNRQPLTSPTSGFCGAGLYRHSGGRGHSSLPLSPFLGAFLEVSSPSSAKPCRTLPPLGSPTSRPVRQVWALHTIAIL